MNATILLLVALAILLAIDWLQTLTIARNPGRWRELNPLLGEHPSVARVNAWFAFVALLAAAFCWRMWDLPQVIACAAAALAVAEGACVVNNFRKGIRP